MIKLKLIVNMMLVPMLLFLNVQILLILLNNESGLVLAVVIRQ